MHFESCMLLTLSRTQNLATDKKTPTKVLPTAPVVDTATDFTLIQYHGEKVSLFSPVFPCMIAYMWSVWIRRCYKINIIIIESKSHIKQQIHFWPLKFPIGKSLKLPTFGSWVYAVTAERFNQHKANLLTVLCFRRMLGSIHIM